MPDYTVLHSHQQCVRVPIFPHFYQHVIFRLLLLQCIIVILVDVKWYLIVVLMCISLMASDAEHLFMCWLAICISSLEKGSFKSFAHF